MVNQCLSWHTARDLGFVPKPVFIGGPSALVLQDQFVLEHFSPPVLYLVELYKPLLPILVVTLSSFTVSLLKKGERGRRRGDKVLVVLGVVRLLCVPGLLILHQVSKLKQPPHLHNIVKI